MTPLTRSRADTEGRRIVLVGASGYTNLGDDAILAAMLAELRDELPGATFVVASGDPARLAGESDVVPIRFEDGAIDAALGTADLLVVGGGGFIYDHDMRLSMLDFLRGDRRHVYRYFSAALIARNRGVPVYFYAVGVGPLVTPAGRALTRDVLSLASAITVRDALSSLELQRAGLSSPAVQVTADPAVRLRRSSRAWSGRPDGLVVGFVVRPWLSFVDGEANGNREFERYVEWLADAADHVAERWSATPVFLPAQRLNDDDAEIAAQVLEQMRHRQRARILDLPPDYESFQAAVESLDALVSSRLHPLIFAAQAQVPLIGIALAPKVRAFLAALGLGQLALSPWHAQAAALRAALDRLFEDPEPIRGLIETGMDAQARAASRNASLAGELVGRT
jgi:polysaccharide pyruvyl transferase CsaB